ncbi:DedA family protein [Ornithinimicrobium cavernae]|uniref:DedA family protein n=1 Tax=Ornithinimicrobium cavernae TaxID=2666047 RepID=UPI00137947E4|nr:DedA family protein [Ornithinimicrobium cavernae]
MPDVIDTLNTVLLDAAAQPWVPLALLLFCAVDGIFPPVPSESLVIGLAAVSAATGAPNVWLVLLAGAAGAALGDLTAYLIGRRVGTQRFRWLRRPRTAALLERTGRTLERRRALFLISGRFVPVVRVLINLTAGASGLPLRHYLPLNLTAAAVWSSFGVGVGLVGGTWMHDNPLLGLTLAIGLGVALGALVDRLVRHHAMEPEQEYAEEPAAG